MNFELPEELKLLQEAARRFTNEELIPHELEVDEHSRAPEAARATIRERACRDGLWPMNVPQEFGGLGSSVLAQVIVRSRRGVRRITSGAVSAVPTTRFSVATRRSGRSTSSRL
jgi:alkylation response protein AidB-like acyl-CoA dehydrogenase